MSSHPFISRLQKSPKKRCTPRRKVGTALGGSRSPFHLICPLVELLEPRRLLAAGDIDTSFGTAGVVKTSIGSGTSEVTAMALQPDGKTVAVGLAQGQGYAIARYNTDGSLDTSFGTGGTEIITSAGSAWQVAMQPDSKILLAGDTNDGSGNALVVRLTAEGAFDTTFGTNGETKVHVGDGTALALDSSGNILVAGDVGGNFDVARLSPDGTLNTTFGNDGIASFVAQPDANGTVAGLAVQKDGKIVVGGTGGATATTPGFAVVRFNSDGTPDTSFGSGGIAQTIVRGDDSATAATIQSDGKIVVAGSSRDALNGVSYNLAMTRFNADGSLDTTFGSGGQVLDQFGSNVSMIFDLLVEPNGKIVASGQADGYAALFRFDSDGSLDQTFGNGGVALSLQNTTSVDVGEGRAVVEQADGKYVMASDQFTLERFVGEPQPTTSGISDVTVPENTAQTVVVLVNDFQGGSVPASQLAYSITADSNSSLFTSTTIDAQTGNLTLAYAPNQTGTAQFTVRGADPDGAYVESTFSVTVNSPNAPSSISGEVWADTNTNGILDSGDTGVPDAVVLLYQSMNGVVGNAGDPLVASAVSDAQGHYDFVGLAAASNYYVEVRVPFGYSFSPENAGSDTALNSRVNSLGQTALIALTSGETNTENAGVIGQAAKFGLAFDIPTKGLTSGTSITTDTAGNIYVAGTFSGTQDFDPGPGIYDLTANAINAFVAKYTSSGALLWARCAASPASEANVNYSLEPKLVVDRSGNAYVLGQISAATDFNSALPGSDVLSLPAGASSTVYLWKLDSQGNFVWVKDLVGGQGDGAAGLAVDSSGNLYATGAFSGTADFDPGPAVDGLTSGGGKDIFVSKLTADGSMIWAKDFGGCKRRHC